MAPLSTIGACLRNQCLKRHRFCYPWTLFACRPNFTAFCIGPRLRHYGRTSLAERRHPWRSKRILRETPSHNNFTTQGVLRKPSPAPRLSRESCRAKQKNFTTKLPRTTLGTGILYNKSSLAQHWAKETHLHTQFASDADLPSLFLLALPNYTCCNRKASPMHTKEEDYRHDTTHGEKYFRGHDNLVRARGRR